MAKMGAAGWFPRNYCFPGNWYPENKPVNHFLKLNILQTTDNLDMCPAVLFVSVLARSLARVNMTQNVPHGIQPSMNPYPLGDSGAHFAA